MKLVSVSSAAPMALEFPDGGDLALDARQVLADSCTLLLSLSVIRCSG
jgi:hypothetical protein